MRAVFEGSAWVWCFFFGGFGLSFVFVSWLCDVGGIILFLMFYFYFDKNGVSRIRCRFWFSVFVGLSEFIMVGRC